MDNKNTWEWGVQYSKVLPYWVLNPENKPTRYAYFDYIYNNFSSLGGSTSDKTDLFRIDERTLDSLTLISKDPDVKYLIISTSSSTPIVQKPFKYTNFHYAVEKVSFYATGVWKIEFKRDYIDLWIQFFSNIFFNSKLQNIRTLTTRTNLINDNYQFEDEKLKELPLKISGWKIEELVPANNMLIVNDLDNGWTQINVDYTQMEVKWRRNLGDENFKKGILYFSIPLRRRGIERTSFQEYYVFNTEEFGMVYIPKVNFGDTSVNYGGIEVRQTSRDEDISYTLLRAEYVEEQLVNKKWASQFLGVYVLPNWLTTSIPLKKIDIVIEGSFTLLNTLTIPFGINATQIMSIDYEIPELLKIDITKNKKLGVNNTLVSQSILQAFPTYLNYVNNIFNFQKYPDFFDIENNTMNLLYDFIFTGMGNITYYTKYETIENWIKTLPNQLPSSTSKFAQYIQANQNVLQTGIWVKQEEAKLNQLNAFSNAAVGAGGSATGLVGFAMGNPIMGVLGALHGLNQTVQGATNFMRAENEVKFEKARVKAKYADTFNSSTRQINYSQSIDALSKEFLEARVCDIIIYPIIDNKDVYNDTIVRCGNKTYEFFKLNDLLTVGENKKYNYFEVSAENFLKETTNYPLVWEHFTYEEISIVLDWLESGVRLWDTEYIEYDYQE